MSFISTLRRRGKTRTRVVFSTFVVVWMSLLLQPCAVAATMSLEMPVHAVVQGDSTHSGSAQVNGHGECPLASADDECCRGTSGTHEGTEASKRSLTLKNGDDRSDSFAGELMAWTVPESIFLTKRFTSGRPAEALPAGPPINIRNCVYLI